jgi:S-DNA-T family DNA segregation ATPase FtsK/SpoIIIE
VRITVHPSLDLDARPGASVRDICAAARAEGISLARRPWCGNVVLDADHPVGVWPLVEGALLSTDRSRPCAPPRGLTVRVVSGPDAGGWVAADHATTIGRDPGCGLLIADPSLSRVHAQIAHGRATTVADAGSTNGTARWRSGRRRRIGRRIECDAGDLIEAGDSLLALEDPDEARRETPAQRGPSGSRRDVGEAVAARLGPLIGSLGTAAMMAAMTGRWWILLVGMLYPGFVIGPAVLDRFRSLRFPPDLAAIPSPLDESREFWGGLTGTIAIAGDSERAQGFARAVVLARGRAPLAGAWGETWMSWLAPADRGDAAIVVIEGEEPPSWADTVVRVGPRDATILARGRTHLAPAARVSRESAEAAARAIAGASRTAALPSTTRLADLAGHHGAEAWLPGAPRILATPIGVTAVGPLELNLDLHGPHLLVAGTTGSGKSALLETLVLGLADRWGPADLAVALIDFKGGAGLRSCMDLPHVAGTLTDLDPHLARRALTALAEELADRKRSLAEAGHASFHGWEAAGGAPARLLVIADEYQELVAHYREFLPDLTRIAAQGRSLGLHLVLATQRPAGAVTPEIRANIGSTVALRVSSEAESRDLIGAVEASEIPRELPGRAILAVGPDRTPFQAALPSSAPSPLVSRWSSASQCSDAAGLADRVRQRWSGSRAPSLWLPPLPGILGEAQLPRTRPGEIWLGRGDIPEAREQPEITWDPTSGPLVVAGPSGSGRTTVLRTAAAQARSCGLDPVWLPADPREAARTVALLHARTRWLLIIDDGVRALASLGDVDRGAPREDVVNMLACAKPVVLALPLSGPQRLASHAALRVVLAGGDPSDEALWSVPRSLQGRGPASGRAAVGAGGRWLEVQMAMLAAPALSPLVASLPAALGARTLPRDLTGDGFPIGVGGDDAAIVRVNADRTILVVGESGHDRAAVAATIALLAERAGVAVAPRSVDNVLAIPRGDLERATVVVAAPNARLLSDVHCSDAAGLVDPRPGPGRVLVVADGVARAVQLADTS